MTDPIIVFDNPVCPKNPLHGQMQLKVHAQHSRVTSELVFVCSVEDCRTMLVKTVFIKE